MEKTIINLNDTNTKQFNHEELIQKEALDILEERIAHFLKDIDKPNKDDYSSFNKPRYHNSILVNGKRGIGKTSFILSSLKSKTLGDVCKLGIIDPTLIETKEHLLLNIISSIKDCVDLHYEKLSCKLTDSDYMQWKKSLIDLARGVSILDGVGRNHLSDEDIWDSPEIILEQGLSNSRSGNALESKLHDFIDESLKVLSKKAFILILDDVDTSLDKGAAILETLRKYLTSNKLITVILGDIELYSILARQLQWQKLDPKEILKKYEIGHDKSRYYNQIEHLEEQYLTKILKPENRIDLKSLYQLGDNIYIKTKDSETELDMFFSEFLKDIYLVKSLYKNEYKSSYLNQSTRSILQILKVYNQNNKEGKERSVTETIRHTFYTTLRKTIKSYGFLDVAESSFLFNRIGMYVIKENFKRDTHLKLLPDFEDDDKNTTMLYLNALLRLETKPSDYMSYFVKVGFALERYNDIKSKTDEKDTESFVNDFLSHIGLDDKVESTINIAQRLLSTISNYGNESNIPIFGVKLINKADAKNLKSNFYINFIMSRVYVDRRGGFHFISIFNLIGFMATISDVNDDKEVEKMLAKLNQVRSYDSFHESVLVTRYSDYEESDENGDGSPGSLKELAGALKQWKSDVKDLKFELPMFVLAKIWIRFAHTLNGLEFDKIDNLLEGMKLIISSFLNAIYVEAKIYDGEVTDLNLKNPKTDKDFFSEKLKKDEHYNAELGKINPNRDENCGRNFFDYVSSFPLFRNFLEYYKDLDEISLGRKSVEKIDFKSLSDKQALEVIKSVEGYKNYKVTTIASKIRNMGYSNISVTAINKIIKTNNLI